MAECFGWRKAKKSSKWQIIWRSLSVPFPGNCKGSSPHNSCNSLGELLSSSPLQFGWELWFEHKIIQDKPGAISVHQGHHLRFQIPRSNKELRFCRFRSLPLHFAAPPPIFSHLPWGPEHCTCQEKQICSGIWAPFQVCKSSQHIQGSCSRPMVCWGDSFWGEHKSSVLLNAQGKPQKSQALGDEGSCTVKEQKSEISAGPWGPGSAWTEQPSAPCMAKSSKNCPFRMMSLLKAIPAVSWASEQCKSGLRYHRVLRFAPCKQNKTKQEKNCHHPSGYAQQHENSRCHSHTCKHGFQGH